MLPRWQQRRMRRRRPRTMERRRRRCGEAAQERALIEAEAQACGDHPPPTPLEADVAAGIEKLLTHGIMADSVHARAHVPSEMLAAVKRRAEQAKRTIKRKLAGAQARTRWDRLRGRVLAVGEEDKHVTATAQQIEAKVEARHSVVAAEVQACLVEAARHSVEHLR